MTSGAPIYLVSACTSGEEFISAFRRYADRNGVMFIPIAEPLPAGRKGRFALALSDGGVMIEGQAEVVSSARTPSVLYGRVGMTVKFLAPDEASQTILSELEKARTSLKPPPPSVPARPAAVPAEPRPRPPAPGGRIDAVNALAECVVIGDVSTLSRDSDLGTIPPPLGKNPSGPVPVIAPKVGSAPVPVAAPKVGSAPVPVAAPKVGSAPVPVAAPKVGSAPVGRPPGTSTTTPPPFQPRAADRSKPTSIPPAVPPLPGSIPRPPQSLTATTIGMPPTRAASTTTPAPSAAPPPATPRPLGIAAPPPPVAPALAAPPVPATREEAVAAALKFAHAVEARGGFSDDTVKGSPPGVALGTETIRGTTPAPMNTLIAPPPPIQYPSATDDADEKTDVASVPTPPEQRTTEVGVPVTPLRMPTDDELRATTEMSAAPDPDADLEPVEQVDPLGSTQAAIRLSKLQPAIEEPSGDWTMSTNDGRLTITPRKPAGDEAAAAPLDAALAAPIDVPLAAPIDAAAEPTPTPAPLKAPPTGDYIIALDPTRPDGWSEPSKVKRPAGEPPPGPPVSAVASDRPLDSDARAEPTIATDEPKIQIDPTLIEPLQPLPAITDDEVAEPAMAAASAPALPVASASSSMPQSVMVAQPGAVPIVAFPPPAVVAAPLRPPVLANASASNPVIGADPAFQAFVDERAVAAPTSRRRLLLIAGAVVVLVGAAIAIAMTRGGTTSATSAPPRPEAHAPTSEASPAAPPSPPPSAAQTPPANAATPTPANAATPAPAKEPPAPDEPAPPDEPAITIDSIDTKAAAAAEAPAAPSECTLVIVSAPAEAELSVAGEAKGTTPVTLTLPCGEPVKLTLKKQRYQTLVRDVTPKAAAKTVKLVLARTTFTVKVSSSPPGATVTLGGKVLGMTPTTVKVPAFEASTLKISKDGYTAETQKVSPKNNASSINVALKKAPKASKKR